MEHDHLCDVRIQILATLWELHCACLHVSLSRRLHEQQRKNDLGTRQTKRVVRQTHTYYVSHCWLGCQKVTTHASIRKK